MPATPAPDSAETRTYVVLAEVQDFEKPLVLLDLNFARLIDEVLVPYNKEKEEPFFLDGVPVTRSKVRRIKILRDKGTMAAHLHRLNDPLVFGNITQKTELARNYGSLVETLARAYCEDVTSQVVQAFNTTVKPKLRDYLPKREELIEAALKLFLENVKYLGGGA